MSYFYQVYFVCKFLLKIRGHFSGVVVTQLFELVPNAEIEVKTSEGNLTAKSDAAGKFSLQVPRENLSVKFFGKNIEPQTQNFSYEQNLSNLQIKINYLIPPLAETVTIEDEALTPTIETRNAVIYNETLFGRDDQLIFYAQCRNKCRTARRRRQISGDSAFRF